MVAATAMLKLATAVCAALLESITFTAKGKLPACVGVPPIAPEEAFKLSPGGNCPEANPQT
jgi:hypothetical protein